MASLGHTADGKAKIQSYLQAACSPKSWLVMTLGLRPPLTSQQS